MLSGLPKLLDKNFVIGFFLPALLAVMLVAWTFHPLPILEPLRNIAASDKKLSDMTYVILIVSLLAIVLLTTNNFQYRLLEGYLPPVSWCAPLRWWQQHCFGRLVAKTLALEERRKGNLQGFPPKDLLKLARLKRKLLSHFPASVDQVMPTQFGNTIRAFEVYPLEVYGVDSVPVWFRLTSIIPKDFAEQINDARTRVDCLVNISCLITLISLGAITSALWNANWEFGRSEAFFWGPSGVHEFHTALVGLAVGFLAYKWAIVQAEAWGEVVKSAFDCYLPALIKQLGYEIPQLEVDRREFWAEFNRRVVYQYSMTHEWPLAAREAPKAPVATASESTTPAEE